MISISAIILKWIREGLEKQHTKQHILVMNTLANSTGEIPGQQEVKGTDMSSESDRWRLSC